ncbi:unnamed protein product [Danaus chrysippus]|uniref:(African queen) hypothetical protein n=1 Tax=Danaus chrysippus TaxID=151541 RepID=A0A8J2VYU1_9NEOP|nr:unnamed protein product [Danaus chrysippus]
MVSTVAVGGMRIPIENTNNDNLQIVPSASTTSESLQVQPIYYTANAQNLDSYIIPDPHKTPQIQQEVIEEIPTPATYLLPPSPYARNEFFLATTETNEESDWYPIQSDSQKQSINEGQPLEESNLRSGKALHRGQVFSVPIRNLLPPKENAPNDFIVVSPSVELELPIEEIDHTINNPTAEITKLRTPKTEKHHFKIDNIPHRHISPPKYNLQKYTYPTKLYPKKYIGEFKPIPIPISQYSDGSTDIPVARPVKVISPDDIKNGYVPIENIENSYENIQKLNQNNEEAKTTAETVAPHSEVVPSEQDTSETNFRHPIRDAHSAPAKQISQKHIPLKSDGKRTEFRMHGMKGPHSYQFGYDTGKGKNRQFRYEERDNDGHVRGHYGYVDRGGKLRVVNYDADPVHGFRAEAPVEKDTE